MPRPLSIAGMMGGGEGGAGRGDCGGGLTFMLAGSSGGGEGRGKGRGLEGVLNISVMMQQAQAMMRNPPKVSQVQSMMKNPQMMSSLMGMMGGDGGGGGSRGSGGPDLSALATMMDGSAGQRGGPRSGSNGTKNSWMILDRTPTIDMPFLGGGGIYKGYTPLIFGTKQGSALFGFSTRRCTRADHLENTIQRLSLTPNVLGFHARPFLS